ncbi:MAG: serine--tRNA ligase [Verrucomicrobiota bacterium]
MLDIRLLREDAASVKERLRARGGAHWELVDQVLASDEDRRKLETRRQELQAQRNQTSKQIGQKKKAGEDTSEIEAAVKALGEEMKALGTKADEATDRQRALLLQIPNLPQLDCPLGADETANPELRAWSQKPAFSFRPKDHVELGADLGLFDFEAAASISGSGYLVFRSAGAKLQRALIQFLLDLHTTEHAYEEVAVPYLVQRDCMIGTGQLPKFEDDMYGLEDGQLFLAPTAEVPVTNLQREKLLSHKELPIRNCAHTPCFRREAGAAGRESKGMIRMHQFDKVELVQVVRPEESQAVLESLTGQAEKVLERLGLHYRTIELCTGDLGFSAAKTYDIEVWAPGHGAYLEVSSCSNFGDYQARRMNLRFKDEEKKNRFCHTLNGSGTALPRLYVALIETYQREDGSIAIPEALQPYFGATEIR